MGQAEDELAAKRAKSERLNEMQLEHVYNTVQSNQKMQNDFAMLALRSILIAHGGALVGMLTFLGNVQATVKLEALGWAFGVFVAGFSPVFLPASLHTYRRAAAS